VMDVDRQSTYCPNCHELLIRRNWYRLGRYRLTDDGKCTGCGAAIAGVFEGPAGSWGAERRPVRLAGRGDEG
jgi:pyruvate formate lyase activating enzyme